MRATILHSKMITIIENGEADESIGVDMLVDGDVADEDDFWRFDGLRITDRTY